MLHISKRRSLSNIVLDFVFVAWLAYFLVTGSILPAGLLASNPPTQATHIEEAAPVQLPIEDDQAFFDDRAIRSV